MYLYWENIFITLNAIACFCPIRMKCICIKVSFAESSAHSQPASLLAYRSWLLWSWTRPCLPPGAARAPQQEPSPTRLLLRLGWTPPALHSPGLGGSPAMTMLVLCSLFTTNQWCLVPAFQWIPTAPPPPPASAAPHCPCSRCTRRRSPADREHALQEQPIRIRIRIDVWVLLSEFTIC